MVNLPLMDDALNSTLEKDFHPSDSKCGHRRIPPLIEQEADWHLLIDGSLNCNDYLLNSVDENKKS